MTQRADEIRKRIANRKRARRQSSSRNSKLATTYLARDEERHGIDPFPTYEGGLESNEHPLFKKEWFMFKILGAACLLLVVAIMYKDGSDRFGPARDFIATTMEDNFQFAAVSSWYEDQFGTPLALLPVNLQKETIDSSTGYSVPASGKILENFSTDGQGVMIETENSSVEAINGGTVLFIGKWDGIGGLTVKVQHGDGSESWYGNLENTEVLLYDFIEKGAEIGRVTESENGIGGTFYFAIKKGENFIDPIQVINFE